MKVRNSQIPEEDGKPIRQNKKGDFLPYPDDFNIGEDFEDDDGKKRKYIKMLHLKEEGIVVNMHEIATIDKERRFSESAWGGGCRWQYGIIINKGMKPTMNYPRVDLDMWYEKEQVRDERYDEIVAKLNDNGIEIVEL